LYATLIRPLLFLLPAETAHGLVMALLRSSCWIPGFFSWLGRGAARRDPALRVEAMGLTFDNPVGLAAGLDKDAEAFLAFGALGFGLVEVGTLTGRPQPGNPRPRLFRLRRDRALVNRMGFNNCGAKRAAFRLAKTRRLVERYGPKLGANIGRSKAVPNEQAVDDYVASARALAPFADYLVVNVSSPNTPGLRELQDPDHLVPLLKRIRSTLEQTAPDRHVPLLVKVAPDLSDDEVDTMADVATSLELDGIIATNTTVSRSGLASTRELVESIGAGGLSGPPVARRALEVLRRLKRRVGPGVVLIASGGIVSADDAWQRIRAGATLVQVYTALVYEGPGLPARLARGLAERVREAGFDNVMQAVGTE
jgi:dihydroorotate dehydrogenase